MGGPSALNVKGWDILQKNVDSNTNQKARLQPQLHLFRERRQEPGELEVQLKALKLLTVSDFLSRQWMNVGKLKSRKVVFQLSAC